MDYKQFRDAFVKYGKGRPAEEREAVVRAMDLVVNILDDVAVNAMEFLDAVHSDLTDKVEDLASQLSEPHPPTAPVAGEGVSITTAYQYVRDNGSAAMKHMINFLPEEYFTRDDPALLMKWYDKTINQAVADFNWDTLFNKGGGSESDPK